MSLVGWIPRSRWSKLVVVFGASALLTLAHFALPHPTHRLHVVHIVLGDLYLLPIIAGALWLGLRGALAVAAVTACAYYVYVRVAWPHQPMENANQFAMLVVYAVVAAATGLLAEAQERERRQARERERCAGREAVMEALAGLANALVARDEASGEHSRRVASLAYDIGRHCGMAGERLEVLRLAALVHDIGKIGVRDDVLLKPRALSAEERNLMERHPLLAAEILHPIHGAGPIAEIVVAHHECPDGSGYPLGRTREQIPPEAHILRVADTFAALTERRPYKSATSAAEAMAMMKAVAGRKLDSASVEALERLIAEGAISA